MRIVAAFLFGVAGLCGLGLYFDLNPAYVPLPRPRPHIETSEEYAARLVALHKEVYCLRDLVYTEARGESEEDQYMVAYVAEKRFEENRAVWGQGSRCNVVYKVNDGVAQFDGPVRHPVKSGAVNYGLQRAFYIALRVVAGEYKPPPRLAAARYYNVPQKSAKNTLPWFATLVALGKVSPMSKHVFYANPPKQRHERVMVALY